MAINYPYKIIRTGDLVETMDGKRHTIHFIVSKSKMIFESTVENLDSVIVDDGGLSKTINRELIRQYHTVERKKNGTKSKRSAAT